MPSTPRSLVLGFAAGLPPQHFTSFASSLRRSGFQGQFGLITAKCTPSQTEALAALADVHWQVDDEFAAARLPAATISALRSVRQTRGLRRLYPLAFQAVARLGSERNLQGRWERLEYELEGLQALRYQLYYRFLRDRAPDADQILLTDLRDVVFQGDPFERDVHGLELFLEDEKSQLGTEPFNTRWLKNLYGDARLQDMAHHATSCSGTTLGDRTAILDYLAQMSAAIQWRRRPLGSHDQGVHNGLLREGHLPAGKIVRNGYGRVLTMGLMSTIRETTDGVILNEDGSIPAVLHQYDRHPALATRLMTRLAG